MAGAPERPFAPGGKDRLGNYSLTKLLRAIQEGKAKEDWDPRWRSINSDSCLNFSFAEGRLRTNVNIGIPSFLSEKLGFDKLKWRIKKVDNSSILLLGYPFEDEKRAPVDQAIATIEVEQRAIAGKTDLFGQVYEPFYLRVAGIDNDKKRIVAATYDLENPNRLFELDVSISKSEHAADIVGVNRISMPAAIIYPYTTAGIVTQKMFDEVNKLYAGKNTDGNFLSYMIAFNLRENDATTDETGYSGYFKKRKDGVVTVGLDEKVAKAKGLHPWKISIPESLPKA